MSDDEYVDPFVAAGPPVIPSWWWRLRDLTGWPVSKLPRWTHRAWAHAANYFWAPCPLCGRHFGGHEWPRFNGFPVTIPGDRPGKGVGICPVCAREAIRSNRVDWKGTVRP